MGKKFIITMLTMTESDFYKIRQKTEPQPSVSYRLCALYEDNHMIEAALKPEGEQGILNNIYIGRVKNVVPNLNAAFVEFQKGQLGFLPFEDIKNPLFTKKISSRQIAAGDELAVQVVKEAMKAKEAVVTTNLSFSGEYLVLTSANHKTGVSSKLPKDLRRQLSETAEKLKGTDAHYGIILRTNAAYAEEADLCREFMQLKSAYEQLSAHAFSRTAFSCLYEERPFYLKMLLDTNKAGLEEVITDDPAVYQSLISSGTANVRLYKDSMLSLASLYSVHTQIEAALKPRVWLKSGANIVIQHTEALTVIDVNSGKNTDKKDKRQYHYHINLEAAREIAVQLRLRNLSGIIIVDFIDLYDDALNSSLMAQFRSYLKQDPVPVQLVDITKLGLVELTRRKQKKPLAEQLQ